MLAAAATASRVRMRSPAIRPAGIAHRICGATLNSVRGSFEHDLAGVATGHVICPLFDFRKLEGRPYREEALDGVTLEIRQEQPAELVNRG